MKSLRMLGAATVAALAVLAAPGARPAAAQAPVITISPPGEGATLGSPSALNGSATMSNGGTVSRASVTYASADGHSSEGGTYNYVRGGDGNSPIFASSAIDSVQFSFTVAPRFNGAYTVSANAAGRDPTPDINGEENSPTLVRRFNVEFAPAVPTGLAASIDDAKKVTLVWNANAEPDMVGYQVQRAYGSGSYKEIGVAGAVAKPSFNDDLTDVPAGQYRYRIVAIRRARTCAAPSSDPACNRGITSQASGYDDVTVRATPATTTTSTTTARSPSTTVRDGSDAGGSNGSGSTGGGSTGSGSGGTGIGGSANVPGGRVDLSDFSALLNGKGKTTNIPDQIDEGTYDPTLKGYDPKTSEDAIKDPGTIEIGGRTIGPLKTSDDWVKFLGAGSLATALLVHVLWFKGQVDNFPLESVAPQGD